jgi:hypothetical protein
MSKKPDPAAGLVEVQPLPRKFAETQENGESKGIFYFHHSGDYLYGYLLCKETVQTLHYPFASYKMRVLEGRQDGVDLLIDKDQVIEFPANFILRRKIDDNELIGSLVKIVYTGKQAQKKGYRVFKDTGTFRKNEIEKLAREKRRRKRGMIKPR